MKILLFILLTSLAVTALAQEAIVEIDVDSNYFHPAASMYVHGDSAGASNLVSTGLSQFPDNGKLLRLKELLDKQQEQEQNQDQQDKDDQDQQDKDDQDQQDKDNQDQQDKDDQQNKNQNDDQEQEQDRQEPQQDPSQQEQQPPSAEQMSQDEAERLLDAMKQEEETKRLQLHPVMGAPVKVDKDW